MSAVAQTDAANHAANEKDIAHQASIDERLMIRNTVPLRILVSALAMLLQKLEADFNASVQLLPEIDPETLDPNNRNCTVGMTSSFDQKIMRQVSLNVTPPPCN